MNLCTNAAHAMELNGGTLTVSLKKVLVDDQDDKGTHLDNGSYLNLIVKDTGSGIPEEIMDLIFDPYFTTKSIGEGTGLGLSVVQGIVRDMGGKILVSTAAGKGSRFSVFFPYTEYEEEDQKPPGCAENLKGNEKILVIDDELPILKVIGRTFQEYGYRIHTEHNAQDALSYLETNHGQIDLVLSDMTMPHMSGMEFSKQIRAMNIRIPIIIMTGYSRLLASEDIASLGIACVLEKPVDSELFLKKIRETLDAGRTAS